MEDEASCITQRRNEMDKPELLDLILTAIDAARKEQQRSDIVLKLTAENGLAPLGKETIPKIL